MPIPVAVLALVLATASAAPALALDAGAAAEEGASVEDAAVSRETRLDQLFETLAHGEADAAKQAERDIVATWMESGSDTIDLLMQWTLKAIEEENYPLALDYLDRITTLKPDYVEGWNKRATVHFLKEEYAKSVSDIERVLALEPRHFGAISGLGTIMREIGDERRAVEAYKRALDIDPYLDNVKDALDDLDADNSRGI